MTQSTRVFAIALVMVIGSGIAIAQKRADWKGRPRYPDGMVALKAGYGFTKYLGEFVDHTIDRQWSVSADYGFLPELALGATAEFGNLHYLRRYTRLSSQAVYEYQFGKENEIGRRTWFSTYDLHLLVNLFPRQYFNLYILAGAGVTLYGPEDYENWATTVPSRNPHLATFTLPIGIGAEWFFARSWAINLELRHRLLFQDDLDAMPTETVRRKMYLDQGLPLEDLSSKDADDSFSTLTVGLRYFLFEDEDLDNDGLSNRDEENLGTNPHDKDSDRDGLDDFEEVTVLSTNPLRGDSDGDGLYDYAEVHDYLTNPNQVDTDRDSLEDGQELFVHQTKPAVRDTDADSLSDGEEVRMGTNPLSRDTDKDGLTDFQELRELKTDPHLTDTDGDEIADFDEVTHEHTNPLNADTDTDGLSDGEEILRTLTDPRTVDTDEDSLTDGDEAHTTGTDPRNRDTDSDGFADVKDRCPRIPAPVSSEGCPEDTRRPSLKIPLPTLARKDTVLRIDTLVIREGGTLTLFGVNFEVDKAVIRPESYPILESNARLFTLYPDLMVEIRGHTDSDGSAEHNRQLSERRAQAVRTALIQLGVAAERLTAKGFGEDLPVASNATFAGKARNRRIEFYIEKRIK